MAACLPRPPNVCKQLPGQPVDKQLPEDSALGDRVNMAFAGTLVSRGRGRGVVTDTALDTELGHVASAVLGKPLTKAPLLVRMERFTNRVAILVGVAALLMAAIAMVRGMPLDEIFLLAVALAAPATMAWASPVATIIPPKNSGFFTMRRATANDMSSRSPTYWAA